MIPHPDLQEVPSKTQPIWNLIWGGVSGFIVLVLSVLGAILKGNWKKMVETIDAKAEQADLAALTQVVAQKADKADIDNKHDQNIARLNEILSNQRLSDERREKLLEAVNKISMDVVVLKYRAGLHPESPEGN